MTTDMFHLSETLTGPFLIDDLSPVALFTKNCRKCKTKIKKSFTKILTIILSVKIVLTLRVKLPCPKCKILIVREILVLTFIVSEKNRKKRWTMYWRFDLKIREIHR